MTEKISEEQNLEREIKYETIVIKKDEAGKMVVDGVLYTKEYSCGELAHSLRGFII